MTQPTVKSLFALVLSFLNMTLRLPLYALVQTLKLGQIQVSFTRSFRLALSHDIFLREVGKTPPAVDCQPPGKEIIIIFI